jgi:selenocysteine lyase/cysteine desulfurase
VAISSTQWSNGFRADLPRLGALCRDRGVWLLVDATQQLGAVPIEVGATPVDLLVCGGHKWLNAPFGCGFLYIRRGLLPRLRPPVAGYLSLQPPAGGWGNFFQTPSIEPVQAYRFVDTARQYEIAGTANYPGAIGLAASLQMILDAGQEAIAARVWELGDRLMAGLDALGVELVTPRERSARAGIVTFSTGDAARNIAMMEHLLERRVLVSVRYTAGVGGVRVSCHFFNNAGDLERLLEAAGEFLRGAVR